MFAAIRSLLFLLPAETAHHVTMRMLRVLFLIPGVKALVRRIHRSHPDEAVDLLGLRFANRVGLAAGFDKNAEYLDVLEALGFGFVEIGTVTPRPQAGNPRPRLFRLPKDRALINRMGFNNDGMERIARRLQSRPDGLVVGGNIGKNKDTANDRAVDDYLACFHALAPFVDYFVVNVSSPNTPGLRELQRRDALEEILATLQEANDQLDAPRPLLLKIAPDLTDDQLDEVADLVNERGLDGLILTNTTIDRHGLRTSARRVEAIGAGGLSGAPLTHRADTVLKRVSGRLNDGMVRIGVGGIMKAEDGRNRMEAGADLLQLYTGFVYGGPELVRAIRSGIRR